MIIRFEESKSKIIRELKKRVPNLICPICKKSEMILMDGFFDNFGQKIINTKKTELAKRSIPTVMIICKQCGHVLQFAIGAFGLLPINKKKERKKTEHGTES